MKLIKNILLIVMICCGIVLSLIINITISSIVYPKTRQARLRADFLALK